MQLATEAITIKSQTLACRAAVVAAEEVVAATGRAFRTARTLAAMDAHKAAHRAYDADVKALAAIEAIEYNADTTPAGSLRAINARIKKLNSDKYQAECLLATAEKKRQGKACKVHEATLVELDKAIAHHVAIRERLEAAVYPD